MKPNAKAVILCLQFSQNCNKTARPNLVNDNMEKCGERMVGFIVQRFI